MYNQSKKYDNIVAQIYKNVCSKAWNCFHPGCQNKTINSHLLQKNGIISNIAHNGHIIEVRASRVGDPKESIVFSKVGVNKALSLDLFCNKHDHDLFKGIESSIIDFQDAKTHLLFSYRALCGELKKKEIIAEWYLRMLNSKTLVGYIDVEYLADSRASYLKGIKDMQYYKTAFESSLTNLDNSQFQFKVFKYQKIKVCAASAFSLVSDITTASVLNAQLKPWNAIFINLIPTANELLIIVGNCKGNSDLLIEEYIQSWDKLDEMSVKVKVTELIATRIETWGICPIVFGGITKEKLFQFKNLWDQNLTNFYKGKPVELNIFE